VLLITHSPHSRNIQLSLAWRKLLRLRERSRAMFRPIKPGAHGSDLRLLCYAGGHSRPSPANGRQPRRRPGSGAVRPALLALCILAVPTSLRSEPLPTLAARVVAVGIPGAGAVSAVGVFHPGGPIHDKPDFVVYTREGRILDPARVLVASRSNFGASPASLGEAEGSVLSIAPGGNLITIAPDFAGGGAQASSSDQRVQLLTAQSSNFLNRVNTPGAVTADLPPVSNPLGISINNGFGRLWFANAPQGTAGPGTLSIVDPGGQPLAGAPSRLSGGVFAGELTGRQPRQLIPGGLRAGAVATALLGMSPDGSKRAVFAVLTADGAIGQAHTEQSVDGLVPAETIGMISVPASADLGNAPLRLATRAGMAFNWVPDRRLYVTDPMRNGLVVLTLADDGAVFHVVSTARITGPAFDVPVDVAPAVPETANPAFSSNTTLAGGSDLYVVNRGSGTLVRLRQDGTVLATRQVAVPGAVLGAGQLNGIAVSPDAQHLWVTVSGRLPGFEDAPGALLEVPAFGPGRAASLEAPAASDTALVERGKELFQTAFTPGEGLGPLFNGRSCLECHGSPVSGGVALEGAGFVLRVGRRVPGGVFDPLDGQGGPVARAHSVAELGRACDTAPGIPPAANVVSVRSATALFGLGLVETIPDEAILAIAAQPGTRGRPSLVRDAEGREQLGRFGWKADTAELEQFVANAFRNELGITSPLAPFDLVPAPECIGESGLKDDGRAVHAVTAYIRSLPPLPSTEPPSQDGRAVFTLAGCGACHIPTLPGRDGQLVPLYSDLLLHDMGPALDDGMVQGTASGAEWRTTPLWGLGARHRFLHDGRATGIMAAILAHDGDGAEAAEVFRRLTPERRDALLAFVGAL